MKQTFLGLFINILPSRRLCRESYGSSRLLKLLKVVLIISTVFLLASRAKSQPRHGMSKSDVDVHQWIKEHFAKGKVPPFSFVYGAKDSKTFITRWKYHAEKLPSNDPNEEKFVYSYGDKQSGLEVKCFVTGYRDFSAVEWVLKFANTSTKNTAILEKVNAINYSFIYNQKGTFILHHANGSNSNTEGSDFMPLDDTLDIEKSIILTPGGGKSSGIQGLPFFNIESPAKQGIMVAIGWSGKWGAVIQQTDKNAVSLKAGMERMKLMLYPNEEIRTPEICLLFWKGKDRMIGHNQFRQFILAHHTPKIDGKHIEIPLSAFLGRHGPAPCNEHSCATESYTIAMVHRFEQFNLVPEAFWIDAGWFPSTVGKEMWYENVGNWTVDKTRFPNGFKPVSDVIHAAGAKFIVWFEPERVHEGVPLAKEHPEWLVKLPGGGSDFLFDLGNTDARQWMTNYISDFIKKEGIDIYRQDLNLDPMVFWEKMDSTNRIGISEIRHIEGLYAFWDSLLVRFPNLIIDNCAGGGQRIDLEAISRSAPFWRTDNYNTVPSQCHTYGLNFYVPLSATCNATPTDYGFRSTMGCGVVLSWMSPMNESWGSIPQMQKDIKDFKRLRAYYYGDYYPLTGTKNMLQDNVWLAYQLNRPGIGDGIIMAFRRKDSPVESIQVKLRGLDGKANYELYDEDSGIKITKTGDELMNGITLSLLEKPGSLLIDYKRVL